MVLRLIRGPVLISIAVTLVRLGGELGHVSDRWFQRATGGILPSGAGWVLGISWLPVLFGPYFLDRLRRERGPAPSPRVLLDGVIGGAFVLLASRFVLPRVPLPFPSILVAVWAVMAAGALLQAWGWLPLFKALLAYGLASRAVVALVMFFAMVGDWGTHYDYVGMPAEFQMPLLPRFLWLAFFPQLIFWVGFTVILGSLSAGLYGILTGRSSIGPVRTPSSGERTGPGRRSRP
jgi:hypothetical protein